MFWKLFGSYGTLILTSLGILGALASHRTQQELLRNVEQSLRSQAELLQPIVQRSVLSDEPEFERELLTRLGKRAGVRITVIDRDGVVLSDSAADAATMDNHANRPEIRNLATSNSASVTRKSDTTGFVSMYVATRVPADSGEPIGYLRLAARVDLLQARVDAIGWIVWGGALVSALIALLLGLWLANHFSRRVEQLSRTANAIAQGDYDRPIDVAGNDQIGSLARSLDRMRRQLTEHIAESERIRGELQTILETMPEGVAAIDPDSRILFANPKTQSLFGLKAGDLSGQRVWEVLRHPGLQQAVEATLALAENHVAEFEIMNPHKVIAFRGTILNVDARNGVLMVLQDVTDLRRLERMRQDFIASVSHELKTPLAAIKAYAETLLDDVDDITMRRRFLHRIDEQADRLNALVVDMLMLARVESNEQAFEIQNVDLCEVVEQTLPAFEDRAKSKSLEIRTRLDEDARSIVADPEGVAIILGNLIDNAVKYAPAGGWVEIASRRESNQVAVSVSDNGAGIPAEDLGRVFERFYRVDKARSRELGGTGLGLSIVKHLAQTFRGAVEVESRLGQGSRFTVRLPFANEEGAE